MVESALLRLMLTRWFAARRIQAGMMTIVLTKGVEKLLAGRAERASILSVQQIDHHHYEVRSGTSVNVVNMSQRKCSYRMFDLDKLTCIHAIAAVEKANICRISKCHPYFWTEYLRKGYANSIMPIDDNFPLPGLVQVKVCKPPYVRPKSGRPKLSRIKGHFEMALASKKPRKPHACSNCGHVGHNRKTCIG
ncbi:hypothetical protein CARUB_v10002032mg [Capsella rubella]|uniref:Zinc finger PMZ-type domain-containing protein n=1 Tax=Capsella rubella TaxID=81985 RepID=R0GXJ0_9BRAS|nr:uncharacterized protein LOC17882626 isoform X2 [Capsella rubella]XP_023637670.1 uncharacterized protein LOC17882626 isoform X2 [Capsella rubella]XP_023637671.1 uncharacterized protein LOC17882626 isoform X2 [Capsella rubella]XP_023637672.1 uncharacterized protein LOC17882626 isoform X2 [Capsella rubella]EOA21619.1 hypothetical protein CARUB_v10002032mg [Capsella rubella]